MNTDMKKYVESLLESYHKREREIAILRFELSAPAQITEQEMIDTMLFARPDDGGHTEGHISDKTPYIALGHQERAAQLNAETIKEVSKELLERVQTQTRLEYYVSLLEHRQQCVLCQTYFERVTQEAVAKELGVTVRTVQDIKAKAIGELAEMYSFSEKVK